jgi:hypothetical protein
VADVRHAATITWKGRMMNVVAETPAWTATPPRRPLRTPVLFGLAAALLLRFSAWLTLGVAGAASSVCATAAYLDTPQPSRT